MHLIETNIPNVSKVGARPSALDVLLFLENEFAMPEFHISHISNVSGLHKDEMREIMIQAVEEYLQDEILEDAVFPRNVTDKINIMRIAGVSAAVTRRALKTMGRGRGMQ